MTSADTRLQDTPVAGTTLTTRNAATLEEPPHRHAAGQFVLVKHGHLAGGTQSSQWLLQSGMAVWIPPWQTHWGQARNDVEIAALYLSGAQSRDMPTQVTPMRATALMQALVDRLLDTARPPPSPRLRRNMIELLREEIATAAPDGWVLPLPSDRRLQIIANALLNDPSDRRTLSSWASEVGATERTLARLFKRETGMNFRNWCHTLRLREAIQGLSMGMNNAALSGRLGFSSANCFVHWFVNMTGASPKSHRPG